MHQPSQCCNRLPQVLSRGPQSPKKWGNVDMRKHDHKCSTTAALLRARHPFSVPLSAWPVWLVGIWNLSFLLHHPSSCFKDCGHVGTRGEGGGGPASTEPAQASAGAYSGPPSCSATAEDPKPGAGRRSAFQQGTAAAHKPAAFRSSASCCAKGSSLQTQKAGVYWACSGSSCLSGACQLLTTLNMQKGYGGGGARWDLAEVVLKLDMTSSLTLPL